MSCSKIDQMESASSWSTLPLDLTGLILRRLPAHTDRLRFAAVCRNWRFSSRQHGLSPPLPWLALPDGTFFSLPHNESFQFPDSSGYHSCSGEWLVFLRDGTCSLMNPFTKFTLVLPNLSSIQPINEPEDIVNGPSLQAFSMGSILLNMIHGISIWKVTVCSPLLVAAIFVIGSIRTIGFCRPGASSWFMSNLGNRKSIMDIVFYEGKLYAIDSSDLFAISIGNDDGPGEPRVSHIARVIEGPPPSCNRVASFLKPSHFLVEHHGTLLRVCREAYYKQSYPCETTGKHVVLFSIKVLMFEADPDSSQWVKMKSIGDDTALFMGKGCSRSVCVSQYKPWGNCIFFLDDGSCSWFWKEEEWSCCLYSMQDDDIFSPPEAAWMCKKGPGAWLFPQL